MKTFIIFGGAGCGKTTYASRQIRQAVTAHGPDRVVVTSFTKASAVELIGRGLPVDEDRVGTLHALCYRALGSPIIAESRAAQWSQDCGNPAWAITGTKVAVEDADVEETSSGNEILAEISRLRGMQVPADAWPTRLQAFHATWNDWKAQCDLTDFTDLLEQGMDLRLAGAVMFVDECADLTPLQFELTQRWAADMESVAYFGDDLQCIYSFLGASPEHMLRPDVPQENKRLLEQSYRLPRNVVNFSQGIAEHISVKEPKQMYPRDANGSVIFETITGRDTDELNEMALEYTSHIDPDDGEPLEMMILATCSYLIDPIKNAMRKAGTPFQNKYRAKRGDWNPLRSARGTSQSTAQRVAAFLSDNPPYWSAISLRSWTDLIKVRGNLKAGYKDRLAELRNEIPITVEVLNTIFEEYALIAALSRDVHWLREQALASKQAALEYPLRVYSRHGLSGLTDEPKITIGTYHSTKGSESDGVCLIPELSAPAYEQLIGSPRERDTVLRLAYVGATRAKRDLILLAPSSRMALDWAEFR